MNSTQLQIPEAIKIKLRQFQRRIWFVKLIEGISAALLGLLFSYLVVFVLDRFYDTTALVRAAILIVGSLGLGLWLPWVCHRWIWRSRKLEQVARMLKINHPRLGDYLLGIIELVHANDFQGTSETLCRAALAQAERETRDKDFRDAVPYPRHRLWAWLVAAPVALVLLVICFVPAAGFNAMARWIMPWRDTDRFTFTRIEPLPKNLIVPAAEPVDLAAQLSPDSRWNPSTGSAWLGKHQLNSPSKQGQFQFSLPPLAAATDLKVRIGDVRETVQLNPQPRPELTKLSATIELPDYLQRSQPIEREIRGGGLSTVAGSRVQVTAEANRELEDAAANGQYVSVNGNSLETPSALITDSQVLELSWRDVLGLTAKTPLQLKLRCVEDEAPTLHCRELERQRVIMEKDLLSFSIDASDDFGIKSIGMTWEGKPVTGSPATPAQGNKLIFSGNPEASELTEVSGTFSPAAEAIEPQTIQLRLFVEDYLPDREPIYSPAYTIFVLSEDEHAIWMTRRLNEWFKQSLEVYEREQQLYQVNVELRNLNPSELDRPETRRRIEAQAAAESAQARRLNALTESGAALVEEAARNDNFGVDHLEKLADMIRTLKGIHENRMPSVADLLKQAASAAASESKSGEAESQPNAVIDAPSNQGQAKAGEAAKKAGDENEDENQANPSVMMKESSMNAGDEQQEKEDGAEAAESKPSPAPLKLPTVTLDALPDDEEAPEACPAGEGVAQATAEQEVLLAEFQKVAEELQKLISNLEGSTFVKRLKALSRYELVMANDVSRTSLQGFGESAKNVADATRSRTELLAKRQQAYVETIQLIVDDLAAYLTRNPDGKYQTVLNEMNAEDVVKQVAQVAERLASNEPGTSVAHAEWLADTLDRWAEQIVGPG